MTSHLLSAAGDAAVKKLVVNARIARRGVRRPGVKRKSLVRPMMVDLLENRRMLSGLPLSTPLSASFGSQVKNAAFVSKEVSAVHDKIFAATNNLPLWAQRWLTPRILRAMRWGI